MKQFYVFLSVFLVFAYEPVYGQQARADMQAVVWASSCMACHGTDGKAEGVGLTIGGQTAEGLFNTLLEYKTGKRTGTIMQQHAKGYTEDELKRISLFFSLVK
jgi:cytochrome subunit of sulfide dehydrogenase